MPKQKTHKATKKRFRMTANGKLKHRSAGTSHLMSRMSKMRSQFAISSELSAVLMAGNSAR